jgi:hypothetical protein
MHVRAKYIFVSYFDTRAISKVISSGLPPIMFILFCWAATANGDK